MTTAAIAPSRIQPLNHHPTMDGRFVLYWMQQSQRVDDNHALAHAVDLADCRNQPVIVLFALMDDYPEANLRHYTFMLEGIKETWQTLSAMGIQMVIRTGDPVAVVLDACQNASILVCDRGYLKHQVAWRNDIAKQAPCPVIQVESDVIVPIKEVSNKAEYAAYTIRPKINRMLDFCLERALPCPEPRIASLGMLPEAFGGKSSMASMEFIESGHPQISGSASNGFESTAPRTRSSDNRSSDNRSFHTRSSRTRNIAIQSPEDLDTLLNALNIDGTVSPVPHFFKGGSAEARRRFTEFLENGAHHYVAHRNQPQTTDLSMMSPYLHFGQISPQYLAREIMAFPDLPGDVEGVFLEELIVRRELAVNFVYHDPQYDSLDCLPNWAKTTLTLHENDPRDPLYTRDQLEACQTHDPYWNAAMLEMKHSGFMHNYMRMYWGKKVLEWSATPQIAFETLLSFNNTYFLDGRDPNSYAGVGWIFGLNDRAWKERPIYGKVRYMAASGLERKCDIDGYVRRVQNMVRSTDPEKSV